MTNRSRSKANWLICVWFSHNELIADLISRLEPKAASSLTMDIPLYTQNIFLKNQHGYIWVKKPVFLEFVLISNKLMNFTKKKRWRKVEQLINNSMRNNQLENYHIKRLYRKILNPDRIKSIDSTWRQHGMISRWSVGQKIKVARALCYSLATFCIRQALNKLSDWGCFHGWWECNHQSIDRWTWNRSSNDQITYIQTNRK